jgi:hypothetical protein
MKEEDRTHIRLHFSDGSHENINPILDVTLSQNILTIDNGFSKYSYKYSLITKIEFLISE